MQSTAFGVGYGGGVFTCPSSKLPLYQSYSMRGDLFPNFWPNSPFHAVTTAAVDSPSTHIMAEEVGDQAVYDGMEFMFDTHVWFWASNNIDWANIENTTTPDVANSRDCDETGPGVNWNWQRCSQFPRYRHNGVSNFPFLDGHVKAISKGRLDYGHNVYNAQTDDNSFG
ncbi:H-X9-DG-CTERM domain-containing protein [Capsulimonas sp.]|uniref:H-X9-DG-CTERM domain-containing protein n=1 Tax=Capsulimonas sp. TaxID=2494211 RepID=UPI0032678362